MEVLYLLSNLGELSLMKIISDIPGHREVELDPHEQRIRDYAEQLLDEGWGMEVALQYACQRFGTVTPEFRNWWLY